MWTPSVVVNKINTLTEFAVIGFLLHSYSCMHQEEQDSLVIDEVTMVRLMYKGVLLLSEGAVE